MAEAVLPRVAARRRLDLRVVVGVFLMLLSVVGGASVIRHANTRTEVLVLARPVQPGHVITADDLKVAEVGLDPSVQGVIPASQESTVVGRVAGAALQPGQLLTQFALASTAVPKGFVAMSIPAKPEQAVGRALRSGDHVAVIATPGTTGQGRATTSTVLGDVVVLGVMQSSGLSANPGQLVITLLVPQGAAEQLAAAEAGGQIELALLPGEGS